ncbi:hypothetical protein ACIOWG_23305 [Streptomyces sp. NPDC087658]|uniref:hypothetical protein n=1 Tax=Streptomyces sp. NPDC087658 TaxID=3365800 RepID=UPI0038208929
MPSSTALPTVLPAVMVREAVACTVAAVLLGAVHPVAQRPARRASPTWGSWGEQAI